MGENPLLRIKKSCFQGYRYGLITVMLILLSPAWADAGMAGSDQAVRYRASGKSHAATDSARIAGIGKQARFFRDQKGDAAAADSVAETAVREASSSLRPDILFLAYSTWLESVDLQQYPAKALQYATGAERILSSDPEARQDQVFRANANLTRTYLARFEYDRALPYAYRLLSYAGSTGEESRKTEACLLTGRCLEGRNRKIDAFRNYLQATGIAEHSHDPALMKLCYSALSGFYSNAGMYPKAVRYKFMERQILEEENPPDSTAIMWTTYDLLVIGLKADKQVPQAASGDLLSFAGRHENGRMFDYTLALLRTHYIESGNPGLLRTLYDRFPGELAKLAKENPGLFARLKAFFAMTAGQADSAAFYFSKAETVLQDDPNPILQANFYNRYGKFLASVGKEEMAIDKFTRSLKLAGSVDFTEYMLTASGNLEKIYESRKDYRNAYRYACLSRNLIDTLGRMAQKDQLLAMEIEHEARHRELAAEREQQAVSRRHYLQYNAIAIGILTVFVILIMLGSLKVKAWIIRALGFFSFIFLFEFIILLADQKIHHLTHGEPWKVLLIKIGLIAILLPMHHAIEKRVIGYLLNHRLISVERMKAWRKPKDGQDQNLEPAVQETI